MDSTVEEIAKGESQSLLHQRILSYAITGTWEGIIEKLCLNRFFISEYSLTSALDDALRLVWESLNRFFISEYSLTVSVPADQCGKDGSLNRFFISEYSLTRKREVLAHRRSSVSIASSSANTLLRGNYRGADDTVHPESQSLLHQRILSYSRPAKHLKTL